MTTRDADTARALEQARAVADAVLYEGYVLFPYRASAPKNRFRWQFGIIIPEAQVGAGTNEPASVTSEVLLRAPADAAIEVTARFLHPQRRQVLERRPDGIFDPVEELDVAGTLHTTWEEGVERQETVGPIPLAALAEPHVRDVHLDGEQDVDDLRDDDGRVVGRTTRTTAPVDLRVELRAEPLEAGVAKLTTTVRNVTAWSDPGAPRDEVVRHGLVGAHLLLATAGGSFASAIDPPHWAARWAGSCVNRNTFPVLVGPEGRDDVVLSAPIILYDHPEVAPESVGDAFDATEIDELLNLCVLGLTDEEKREARATDPRAAAVIDRAERLPPEVLARLHGAIRRGPGASVPPYGPGGMQPNEPDASQHLDDELAEFLGVGEEPTARIRVDGVEVAVGDRVRLQPTRRADAQDVFAAGRIGCVGKIVQTLDGDVQVAVTLEDDPAAELHEWYGRFLYFHVDEVVPLGGGR